MTDTDHGTPDTDGQRPDARPEPEPHLPPPAFPPGTRRHQMRRRDREASRAGLDEAFISPDDPMPRRKTMDEAFISPDEPIPHREPEAVATADAEADDEVVVTGMGNDPHLDPEEMAAAGDPYVMALTDKVAKLAQALRQRGEAGLRTDPDMDRFDATLRAYCVGYLAGRRAEEE